MDAELEAEIESAFIAVPHFDATRIPFNPLYPVNGVAETGADFYLSGEKKAKFQELGNLGWRVAVVNTLLDLDTGDDEKAALYSAEILQPLARGMDSNHFKGRGLDSRPQSDLDSTQAAESYSLYLGAMFKVLGVGPTVEFLQDFIKHNIHIVRELVQTYKQQAGKSPLPPFKDLNYTATEEGANVVADQH